MNLFCLYRFNLNHILQYTIKTVILQHTAVRCTAAEISSISRLEYKWPYSRVLKACRAPGHWYSCSHLCLEFPSSWEFFLFFFPSTIISEVRRVPHTRIRLQGQECEAENPATAICIAYQIPIVMCVRVPWPGRCNENVFIITDVVMNWICCNYHMWLFPRVIALLTKSWAKKKERNSMVISLTL